MFVKCPYFFLAIINTSSKVFFPIGEHIGAYYCKLFVIGRVFTLNRY